jgi:hypothetical protein
VADGQRNSWVLALTGAIPAIALSAGLLSLSPESELRKQYWPWLPALVLAIGVGSSAVFWLVLAPRRNRRDRDS